MMGLCIRYERMYDGFALHTSAGLDGWVERIRSKLRQVFTVMCHNLGPGPSDQRYYLRPAGSLVCTI